jgi:FtsZ-binding cell division protein ZapB
MSEKLFAMNPAYNIIATAIYTEKSVFTSGLAIIYNGIRICTDFEVLKMVNIFAFNKFHLNDLRNILYIYISITGNDTYKIRKAIEYIKLETRKEKHDKLKQKISDLQKENARLQSQNETLIQTCSNVCKMINDKNVQTENKILNDILYPTSDNLKVEI